MHRTEVSEATEIELGGRIAIGWTLVASVRQLADGECIPQRSRRSQRGIGLVDALASAGKYEEAPR
jgi:hypothetical protein